LETCLSQARPIRYLLLAAQPELSGRRRGTMSSHKIQFQAGMPIHEFLRCFGIKAQ
jgi:hypothetical protein